MDKKSIIGLILIFVVMMGYAYWTSPSVEEQKAAQEAAQAAQAAAEKANTVTTSEAALSQSPAENNTAAPTDTTASAAPLIDPNHPFSLSLSGETTLYTIENEVFQVHFSNLGGRIAGIKLNNYKTYNQADLVLMSEELSKFYLSFFANNRHIRTDELYFQCFLPSQTKIEGDDSAQVKMRLYAQTPTQTLDSARYLEWVYTLKGNAYDIDLQLNVVGLQDYIAANSPFIDLVWQAKLQQLEKAYNMEQMNTLLFYKPLNDHAEELKANRDQNKELTFPLRWVAFKQQFFSLCLTRVDEKGFAGARVKQTTYPENPVGDLKEMSAEIGLEYEHNTIEQIRLNLYAGPNKYNILKTYGTDMERLIPLGWGFFLLQWINRVAVIPVFDFLDNKGLNYGLIILILTILLKIILSPITYKSYLSSAKMRVIQPEVNVINERYPKKEQAMDKQRAVMALYKKAGVSPMAGCIPMLLQFPILIAMFRFFPASIELRQQPFLWADDLSSYDSIVNLSFNIPFYGSHVSLFALLMAVTNLFYTRMTMKQSPSSGTMPGMKFMMYAMPIMFLGFLNSYSSALNYYYCISTLFTFLQMWIIRRFVDDAKVMAQIQENKKRPVKKSKFQERLEKMAKAQQERLRQQQGRR